MMRILVFLLVSASGISVKTLPCFAQPVVRVLSSSAEDTLYRYYTNKIDIAGLRDGDFIRLYAARFRVSGDTVLYSSVRNRDVSFDTLSITRGKNLVYSKRYIIRDVTDPTAFLGGVRGRTATLEEILQAPYLVVRHPGCGYIGRSHVITGFSLSTSITASSAASAVSYGPYLSPADVEAIRQLKKGAKLFFRNINARCAACTTRRLNDVEIIIR